MQPPKTLLVETVKNTVRSNHPKTVEDLARLISASETVYEDEFETALNEAVSMGAFELREPSRRIATALEYVSTVTVSGWFWLTIIFTTCAILGMTFIPDAFPANIIRLVSGCVFVLYLPGFTLAELLFPEKKSLSSLERFALNIGLSIALVLFIGLILNYLALGIGFAQIVVSLSLFVLSFTVLAAVRKYIILRESSKAASP